MRKTIIALVALMALLMLNIIAYSLSENYRFLIKKMKYPSEIVYENEEEIDDTKKIEVLSGTTENQSNYKDISGSSFQFLNEFRKNDTESEDTLRELSSEEKEFLALWEDSKLEEIHFSTYVFDVTDEYPDPYYEWYSENLELYVFPTKNYEEIKNIFEVLSHDLPYSIKETNNF